MTAHPSCSKLPAMSEAIDTGARGARRRYRITVRGRLTERFGSAFDGMALEPGSGETALVGDVRDQSQLHGLLDRIRDLGLELVSVEQERKA
jgi:hypothetical protein